MDRWPCLYDSRAGTIHASLNRIPNDGASGQELAENLRVEARLATDHPGRLYEQVVILRSPRWSPNAIGTVQGGHHAGVGDDRIFLSDREIL